MRRVLRFMSLAAVFGLAILAPVAAQDHPQGCLGVTRATSSP
jgi:hypothetical protein